MLPVRCETVQPYHFLVCLGSLYLMGEAGNSAPLNSDTLNSKSIVLSLLCYRHW